MGIGIGLIKLANALLPKDWKIVKVSKESGLPLATWRWSSAETTPPETTYFYLAPDLALARMRNGIFLYLDPTDWSVASHLISRGYWENWVYTVVCQIVRPNDVVVEVGANFGYYTLAMARLVGESGLVTSYEANPFLASLVEKSAIFNSLGQRTRVVAKAASDRSGTVAFSMSRVNAGGGATLPNHPEDDSSVTRVETVRLDDVTEVLPRFIRIDAEGSEPLILRGAERLLERPDVVVCLEWDILQMASRADVVEFSRWLTSLGFKFWRIDYDSSLVAVDSADLPTMAQCDLVMSRQHPYATS